MKRFIGMLLIVFLFSMKSYGGKYCEISGGDSDESIYPKNTIVEEHTYYLTKEEHWLRDRCEGEPLENSGRPEWGTQKCPQGLFPSFQNDVKFHENGLVKMNDVEFQSFVAKRKKDEIEYFDNKYEIKIDEKVVLRYIISVQPVTYGITKIAFRDFDLSKPSECNILKEYTEKADFYMYKEWYETYRGLCFCEKKLTID